MQTNRTIRLCYADMWGHGDFLFNPNYCYFTWLLRLKYNVVLTDQSPDILIFSCFGDNHKNYSNCLKIFFCGENSTPPGIERIIQPDYAFCDLSFTQFPTSDKNYYFPLWILFVNWFKHQMPFPLPSNPTYLVEPEDLLSSRQFGYTHKDKFCCFINNNPVKDRINLYRLLESIAKVDSYGKLLNNVGYLLGGDEGAKLEILKNTKFTIAYENSYRMGYNTEKVIQPYVCGSIAIYSGGLDRTIFNSKAIFFIEDYNSTEDMVADVEKHYYDSRLFREKQSQPLFVEDKIPKSFEPLSILSWLELKIEIYFGCKSI